MRTLLGWSFSALLLLSAYAQEPNPSRRPIVFTQATVIDVKNGQVSPDVTIVLEGTRITALGKVGSVRLPTDAQVIDATGKYIIPGLWDMHLHFAPWETPLLVANGVTGIREMGSDCHPAFTDKDCLGEVRLCQGRLAEAMEHYRRARGAHVRDLMASVRLATCAHDTA